MAKGQTLESSYPDGQGRFWFIFTNSPELDELSKEYYLNYGTVNPISFVLSQKTLKNLVRNYKPYNIKNETGTVISGDFQR